MPLAHPVVHSADAMAQIPLWGLIVLVYSLVCQVVIGQAEANELGDANFRRVWQVYHSDVFSQREPC